MSESEPRRIVEMVAALAAESSSSADWLVDSSVLEGALCVGFGIE